MLTKAAGLLLVCASVAVWVSCATTSNHYLYAAQPSANTILAYREDPNSGVITLLSVSPIAAGPAVEALALHPSKKYLYAANSQENDVSVFSIDTTGVLTEIDTPRQKADTAPTLLAINAAGSFLYVGNSGSNDVSVFMIDASSGNLTPVGTPLQLGLRPTNLQVSASGNFLYVVGAVSSGPPENVEVFSLSGGVPNPVPVQVTEAGTNPYGLALDPSGKHLYIANSLPDNSISEFTINSDGSLTALATIGGGTLSSPIALLIDNSGKFLYVANTGASNLSAYAIATDGSLTHLAANETVATNKGPSFLASDPNGKYLFVGNSSSPAIQSFSLDPSSGALTEVSSYTVGGTPTSIVVVP